MVNRIAAENEEFVRRQVESGAYPDRDAVLNAGIALLRGQSESSADDEVPAILSREHVLGTLCVRAEQLRAMGVQRLGLFGSTARNEARTDSDLDFIVTMRVKSFDGLMDLKIYLEDLFHRKIDLFFADTVDPDKHRGYLEDLVDVEGLPGTPR